MSTADQGWNDTSTPPEEIERVIIELRRKAAEFESRRWLAQLRAYFNRRTHA